MVGDTLAVPERQLNALISVVRPACTNSEKLPFRDRRSGGPVGMRVLHLGFIDCVSRKLDRQRYLLLKPTLGTVTRFELAANPLNDL